MELDEYELMVREAYSKAKRSDLWLAAALQCEAGELTENIVKAVGYGKPYRDRDIALEAGDIINFTLALLHTHGYTLREALALNAEKMKDRGWVK